MTSIIDNNASVSTPEPITHFTRVPAEGYDPHTAINSAERLMSRVDTILRRSGLDVGHNVFTHLAAIAREFREMSGALAHEDMVPAEWTRPDVNVVPYTPDATQVVITASPAPDVVACNDITSARERFVAHVKSQLRVSKKAALSFIGRTDGQGILDDLSSEGGPLTFVKHGHTAGYAIAPVQATPPAPPVPSVPVMLAVAIAAGPVDDEIPEGFGSDAQNAAPIVPSTPLDLPRPETCPIKKSESARDSVPLPSLLGDATVADLLAELQRRIGTAIPAQNKGRASGAVKELSRVFGLS